MSAQNVVFGQCSLDSIKANASKSASGVVAIFSQEGCPYCPIAVDIAKRSIGGKIPIMQMPLEKGPCLDLATKYKVKETPTIIYFDKHGRERRRIPVQNKTWGQVGKALERLLPKSAPPSERHGAGRRSGVRSNNNNGRRSSSAARRREHLHRR